MSSGYRMLVVEGVLSGLIKTGGRRLRLGVLLTDCLSHSDLLDSYIVNAQIWSHGGKEHIL